MAANKTPTGVNPKVKEQQRQDELDKRIQAQEESRDNVYEAAEACESTPFFPPARRHK